MYLRSQLAFCLGESVASPDINGICVLRGRLADQSGTSCTQAVCRRHSAMERDVAYPSWRRRPRMRDGVLLAMTLSKLQRCERHDASSLSSLPTRGVGILVQRGGQVDASAEHSVARLEDPVVRRGSS
jgi:hypothetical protein